MDSRAGPPNLAPGFSRPALTLGYIAECTKRLWPPRPALAGTKNRQDGLSSGRDPSWSLGGPVPDIVARGFYGWAGLQISITACPFTAPLGPNRRWHSPRDRGALFRAGALHTLHPGGSARLC